MKFKILAVITAAMSLGITSNAQLITTFTNLDFDAGVQNFPNGFDNPAADIPGWQNHTAITDSGVEGPGAWWGTYQGHAAFMKAGEGAFNLSDYTIQAGDVFSIEFYGKCWWDPGAWTVSLFYDNPANVIGSYTTPTLANWNWNLYSTSIAATPASAGGKLGVIFLSSGASFAQVDEITIVVPEPTSMSLMAVAGLGLLLKRRRKN
jgi:hypothetical protein